MQWNASHQRLIKIVLLNLNEKKTIIGDPIYIATLALIKILQLHKRT